MSRVSRCCGSAHTQTLYSLQWWICCFSFVSWICECPVNILLKLCERVHAQGGRWMKVKYTARTCVCCVWRTLFARPTLHTRKCFRAFGFRDSVRVIRIAKIIVSTNKWITCLIFHSFKSDCHCDCKPRARAASGSARATLRTVLKHYRSLIELSLSFYRKSLYR